MNKHKDDIKLAKELMKGNEKLFNQFFNDHYSRIFRFIMHRVNGDYDLADDMAQQTLCKAIDKLQTYRGEASLFTWMCMISRSFISAHFVKTNRRNKTVLPLADQPEIRMILDNIAMNTQDQPEQLACNQELGRLISEVLDTLPNGYGNILEWKYVEELSVNEIATKLGTSMVSVQSSLARARKMFQSIIEKMLNEKQFETKFQGSLG